MFTGLRGARQAGAYPADMLPAPCPVDEGLRDGEPIEVAGLIFRPIHVRGHSRDHFCLVLEQDGERWLFAGDAVFMEACSA